MEQKEWMVNKAKIVEKIKIVGMEMLAVFVCLNTYKNVCIHDDAFM